MQGAKRFCYIAEIGKGIKELKKWLPRVTFGLVL
jgi:hypothetical protein